MKLKEYLYKKRLTPKKFAIMTEIPLPTIYRLQKAKKTASMKNALIIAEFTNNEVPFEELRDFKKD